MNESVNPRVRQIYQEHLRSHPNSTRSDRWFNMLDQIEDVMPRGIADHRGLREAFEMLERELAAG